MRPNVAAVLEAHEAIPPASSSEIVLLAAMFEGWSGPSSVVALKNLIAGMQQEIQERFSGMADNPYEPMIRRMVDAAANSAEAYFRELTDHLVSEIVASSERSRSIYENDPQLLGVISDASLDAEDNWAIFCKLIAAVENPLIRAMVIKTVLRLISSARTTGPLDRAGEIMRAQRRRQTSPATKTRVANHLCLRQEYGGRARELAAQFRGNPKYTRNRIIEMVREEAGQDLKDEANRAKWRRALEPELRSGSRGLIWPQRT